MSSREEVLLTPDQLIIKIQELFDEIKKLRLAATCLGNGDREAGLQYLKEADDIRMIREAGYGS